MRTRYLATATMACVISVLSFADDAFDRLEREFERIAETSGGTMGIAAVHLPSRRAVYLNPDASFPMASTYKVPIAVALLQRVEKGEVGLTDLVPIPPALLAPGSGMIGRLLDDPGVVLSVVNLLEMMLLISDNTAANLCLQQAGGAEAVTQRMRDLGIDGIRVDRSTTEMIMDYFGIEAPTDGTTLTRSEISDWRKSSTEAEKNISAAAFAIDPQDTATPRAMAQLFTKVYTGQALNEQFTLYLNQIMIRCETGNARIKGALPPGTPVAHKTGSIGGSTNDIGVMRLPGDAGELVFVAFIRDSDLAVEDREPAIAHAARAAHDFFLFNR